MKKIVKRLCIHHSDVVEILSDIDRQIKEANTYTNWRKIMVRVKGLEGEEDIFPLNEASVSGSEAPESIAPRLSLEILKILEYRPHQETVKLSLTIWTCVNQHAQEAGKTYIDIPTYELKVLREDLDNTLPKH